MQSYETLAKRQNFFLKAIKNLPVYPVPHAEQKKNMQYKKLKIHLNFLKLNYLCTFAK